MLTFAPLDGAVAVAATIVEALASAVAPIADTGATAAAVVLFTIAVRLLIAPLTWAQVRGERRRAELAPQVRQLQQRYGKDRARLQQELVTLHREAGASPVAGCLPGLFQVPFFVVMYHLFTTVGPIGGTAGLLDERLAGVPLGHHLTDGLGGAAGPLFGVLLVLLTALAWWTSRRMRRDAAAATPATAPDGTELPGAAVLARLLPLLPYGTLLAALVLPLAAVLYLVTTTAWTALERVVLRRPRPLP
ncbi:YidC/Oxa1 family membrane protein insertase [Micromonospora pisi]|uniref:Membrane protein insertase YidC n=1 Tax=Micromonospora pisi TaxID=589240 RepID=A0A495JGM9_9ACTN|nr:membrane protein insertase YidC [Micromonospora pisi]RKR88156.1 YidC/Oxa1 family membrane protein insertase [Micromonospora pisi]